MGISGNFFYRPSYGAQGPTEYAKFDTGLASADSEIKSSNIHRVATLDVHGLVFTGPGSGGGLDSDKLDGYHSGAFLSSGGTAVDSDKLDGYHASSLSLTGHTHPGTDITSIVSSATSAVGALDSDKLDGQHYSQVTTDISTHSSATTGVHGVGGSSVESASGSQSKVDTHSSATTGVHSISASGFEDKENKGAESGYASLDADILVPIAQMASGTPDGTKFIRDDRTLVVPFEGYFQKAKSYCASAQTIPATAWTKVSIDTDTYDSSDITDLTNHRIIPTKAGYYQVNGQISISQGATTMEIIVAIYKNGTGSARGGRICIVGAAGTISSVSVSDVIYCDGSTDYLELYCLVGAEKNLEIVAHACNYLSVVGPF